MARRVGLALGIALGLIIAAVIAAYAVVQTPAGKRVISAQLERALTGPQTAAEVTGLAGQIPFDMSLDRLALSSGEGVWLEIEGLRLVVSPAALLRGRLDIEQVSAERVRILRPPPAAPEQVDAEPFRLPELPHSLPPVVVERLAVERIELARAVLGEAAVLTFSGQLAAADDGRSAALELSARRVDQATARASLDARLALDPAALQLALRVEETGGLLAALSGRPEAGDFALRLSGAGPLDGWTGDLELAAEGLARADGRLEIALAEQPRVRLDGTLRPAPGLLPDQLAGLVGERPSLALTVTQTAAQRLRVEDLRAEIAAAQLTGRAELDFEGDRLSAEARLAVPDLAPVGALVETPASGALSADLVADGALRQPKGRLDLEISAPEVAGVAAERITTKLEFAVHQAAAPDQLAVQVTGEGRAQSLRLPEEIPLPAQDLAWRLDVSAPQDGPVTVRKLALSAREVTLEASGAIDPKTLVGEADVGLEVSALGPLTEPFGQRLDGQLSLEANFSLASAEQIEIDLAGRAQDLAGLPPAAAELLGPEPRLTALASLSPGRRLEVSSLTLKGSAATLGGELALTLPAQGLGGKVTLALPRLAALAPVLGQELSGALEIHASPGGTLDSPTLALAMRSDGLLVAGRQIDEVTLETSARDLLSAPAGKLQAALKAEGLQAKLATDYRVQDGILRLAGLRLTAPRSKLEGALAVDLENTLVEGELQGEVADLVAFAPLLPVPLRGGLDFRLRLDPANQTQTIALVVDGSQLLSEFGRLRRLRLRATVTDALGTPGLEADLELDEFHQDQVALEQATLSARGTLDALALNATARGEAVQPFNLDARARLALGEAIQLRLEQLDGRFADAPLRLAQPAEVTLADGATRLAGLDLRWGDARLQGSADLGPGEVVADVSLRALPLARLQPFGAPALTGQANASLRLSGPADNPRGSLEVTMTGVGAEDLTFAELPAAEFTLTAKLAERRLGVDLDGRGVTEKPMRLTAELPLVVRFDQFVFEVPEDGRLAARLDAELALARLAALADRDDQTLPGVMTAGLTMSGTVGAPRLEGTVEVANGGYANGFTGTVLGDVTATARATERRVVLERFSATDGGGGSLRGSGEIAIDPAGDYPLSLQLEMKDARLVRRDDVDATLRGGLDLTGDIAGMTLAGGITVERAQVRIPDKIGPSVAVIPVKEVGIDGREGTVPQSAGTALPVTLDLSVDLPGQVFVRGRGLESEWQGKLQVTGTVDEPRLVGTLEVKRGYIDFLDQRLDLRKGVITFGGASPPDPTVNVEAVATKADITAIIRIEGPARQPTLTLDSEPPLPQDEVLSRLLFDREASAISPAQAAQLALALNRLRGGGGLDIMGKIREVLGVDILDVSSGATPGENAVRAGKYLNDDVYVEVEKGTAEESGRARVEVEILPNVSVEADTGQDATSGIGVQWRYDY
jgi:translocation and assembly module TamB